MKYEHEDRSWRSDDEHCQCLRPHVSCELEVKENYWSELDELMESIPRGEKVVVGGNINGHIGEGNRGNEEEMDIWY